MKLEDFKKLKQGLKSNQLQEFKGWLGERFHIEKTLILQLTDEELHELSHDLSNTIDSEIVYNTAREEIEFLQKLEVRHDETR